MDQDAITEAIRELRWMLKDAEANRELCCDKGNPTAVTLWRGYIEGIQGAILRLECHRAAAALNHTISIRLN